jgi:hypothetical protein
VVEIKELKADILAAAVAVLAVLKMLVVVKAVVVHARAAMEPITLQRLLTQLQKMLNMEFLAIMVWGGQPQQQEKTVLFL